MRAAAKVLVLLVCLAPSLSGTDHGNGFRGSETGNGVVGVTLGSEGGNG
jgi:hypothetical protein